MTVELTASQVSTLQDFLQSHVDTFEPETADEHAAMVDVADVLGKLNTEPSAMEAVDVDLDHALYFRDQL
jgi:hypothetical protein